MDNWIFRSRNMKCQTCVYYVEKTAVVDGTRPVIGRCRRGAPTMKGFPVVFQTDWCGDHRLDENKL
jgi:hypothetical protein